tara:strand:- start:264 stop:857 length:594 start_codon:yes stop_codon:yes gene_type:complete
MKRDQRRKALLEFSKIYKESAKKRKTKSKLTSKPSSEKTLRDWFARKGGEGKSSGWVDCNTCRKGKCKPCGRKKGEKRSKYPACRPTPASCKRYKKTKGKSWGKKSKASELPFSEKLIFNKTSIRKFAYNVNEADLVWHRDREDRVIEVLSGNDWMVQFDNRLPITMKDGDKIAIKKNSWHRVLKGNGDLIIKVFKL